MKSWFDPSKINKCEVMFPIFLISRYFEHCDHLVSSVWARRRPMAPLEACWCRWDLEPGPCACLLDWLPDAEPAAEEDPAALADVAVVSGLSIHQLDLPVPSFCTRTNLLCSDRLCRMEF